MNILRKMKSSVREEGELTIKKDTKETIKIIPSSFTRM